MASHVEFLTGLVNVAIPEVYQKGMSYYEVLTAVVNKVNELIKQSNEYFSEDVQTVMTKILIGWKDDGTLSAMIADAVLDIGDRQYTEQNYVTNNETITESINKLDMALSSKVYHHDTVANMLTDTSIKNGDYVITAGYHSPNDGGGAEYKIISDNANAKHYYETLINGLYADLLSIENNGFVDIRWLGAKSDLNGTIGTDVSLYIQKALDITNINLGMPIRIVGNYYWGTEISTKSDFNIFGEHRINRYLTGKNNSPSTVRRSPSEIYVDPTVVNAITLEGLGGINVADGKSTHLTIEKLYVHSDNKSSNFIRCTTYGAPSRPGYCQDLEAHGFNNVLLFDFETGANSYGTNYYNFAVRGGCNIYSNNIFINAIGRDNTSPSLGGLNVQDNVIEWNSGGAFKMHNLFGYNQIKNNLIEGAPETIDLTINRGHVDFIGNYMEANSGNFKIQSPPGANPNNISVRLTGNYIYNNDIEYYLRGLKILEMDEQIPLNRVHIGDYNNQSIVKEIRVVEGLTPSRNSGVAGIVSPKFKGLTSSTIESNQFILGTGGVGIHDNIYGKILPTTFSLMGGVYKPCTINENDYVMLNFYKTLGYINIGFYKTGTSTILGYSLTNRYPFEGYYTIIIKANSHQSELGVNIQSSSAGDIKCSDVLVSIIPASESNNAIGKYLGIPIH